MSRDRDQAWSASLAVDPNRPDRAPRRELSSGPTVSRRMDQVPGSNPAFYDVDNVHLTSVGIDIGSSTSHMMFSRIHMRREANALSSRFELVRAEPMWYSDIILTPYVSPTTIDARALAAFTAECHATAGIQPADIDTGAVILTGDALKKQNARPIADALAAASGDFVCVSAGHHLEALLSAHGSGAVALSRKLGAFILCVDIGGGTTKLSLVRGGRVEQTAALPVGARSVSWDERRRVTGLSTPAALHPAGLTLGVVISHEVEQALVAGSVDRILAAVFAEDPTQTGPSLTRRLSFDPSDLDFITFAGGVAEYVYGRETRSFGDLGRSMGTELRRRTSAPEFPLPVMDSASGIRATAVGLGQRTVQMSGATIALFGAGTLRNVPVIAAAIGRLDDETASSIAAAVVSATRQVDLDDKAPRALVFNFDGPPLYPRLKKLADGIALAAAAWDPTSPVVVVLDADVAMSIGGLLVDESRIPNPIICIDHIDLAPFDFIDVGALQHPAGVVPVVIKSLLFSSSDSES